MSLPSVDISWLDSTPYKKRHRRQQEATKKPRGRPAVKEEFPGVVEAASEFVQSNGFKAHRRRQEEIGVCGSSLRDIRDHLHSTVPGLQEQHPNLNVRTIAHWMHPPNKGNKAAEKYSGLIQARIPPKDNSARKTNDNSHFYAARVRYSLEMAAKFSEYVMVYSADNKNKIRIGDTTLAVDRRIRINRFFPMNDAPRYMDHDFPTPGYLLTPSGYLELDPLAATTTLDHLGREHFVLPQKSQSHVFLRSPHSPNNIASHMNDLHRITRPPVQKPVLVLVVDGGPDFNVNFAVNELFYASFFKDSDLDALLITSYCPGDSAMNPIEHLWAPCTRALTSVYLPSTLEGEDKPPSQQSGLTAQEREAKENTVFDSAMARIRDVYWKDLNFAGHRVNVQCEASGTPPAPYSNYDEVKRIVSGSTRALKTDPTVYEHYKFTHRHMDRRIGTIIYTKCTESSCHHCTTHPPRASSELLACLRNFPSPSPSTSHPGHFKTFIEALSSESILPCEHLPLFHEKGLGRCQHQGCKYVYTSKKDIDDHRRKAH